MLNCKKYGNIGFHVIGNSLYAVALEKYQSKIAVLDAAFVKFEKQDDLALAFEKIRTQLPTRIQHCTIGLSLIDVIIKEMPVAVDLSTNEILKFIKAQGENFFGTPSENLMLDYEVIASDKSNKTLRCVAVDKTLVALLLKIIKQLKVHLKIITVDILALEKILPWCPHYSPAKQQGLLVNQGRQIVMAVIENNTLRHIRWGYTPDTLQRYFQVHANIAVEQWFYLNFSPSSDGKKDCVTQLSIPVIPLELRGPIENNEKITAENLCAFALACEGWL